MTASPTRAPVHTVQGRHVPIDGSRVRAWRQARCLSAPELVELMDGEVSLATLTRIEREGSAAFARTRTARALSRALQRPVRAFDPDVDPATVREEVPSP